MCGNLKGLAGNTHHGYPPTHLYIISQSYALYCSSYRVRYHVRRRDRLDYGACSDEVIGR